MSDEFPYREPDPKFRLMGTFDEDAGAWYFPDRAPRWSDLFGIAPDFAAEDDALSLHDLKEGAKVTIFTSEGLRDVVVESNVEQEDGTWTISFRPAEDES